MLGEYLGERPMSHYPTPMRLAKDISTRSKTKFLGKIGHFLASIHPNLQDMITISLPNFTILLAIILSNHNAITITYLAMENM